MACGRLLPQVVSLMMFVIRVVVFVAVKPFMLQLDGAVADIKGFAHGLRHLSKDLLTVGWYQKADLILQIRQKRQIYYFYLTYISQIKYKKIKSFFF